MAKGKKSQHGRATGKGSKKLEALSAGELQGRGGESLPSHEKTILGDEQDWEREDDEGRGPTARRAPSGGRKPHVTEVEYERGPGSKFDIEGQGPRSKRQRTRRSK